MTFSEQIADVCTFAHDTLILFTRVEIFVLLSNFMCNKAQSTKISSAHTHTQTHIHFHFPISMAANSDFESVYTTAVEHQFTSFAYFGYLLA